MKIGLFDIIKQYEIGREIFIYNCKGNFLKINSNIQDFSE